MEKQNTDLNNEAEITYEVDKEGFINLCNSSYDSLQGDLLEIEIEKIGEEKVIIAVARMLGTFQDLEEYDKCIFLRDLINNKFDRMVEPLFDYRKL